MVGIFCQQNRCNRKIKQIIGVPGDKGIDKSMIYRWIQNLSRKKIKADRKYFREFVDELCILFSNAHKYYFLTVDLDAPMSLMVAQKLASWSSWYGTTCRAMRPFCSALNRLCSGRFDRHATFAASEEAKQVRLRGVYELLCAITQLQSPLCAI